MNLDDDCMDVFSDDDYDDNYEKDILGEGDSVISLFRSVFFSISSAPFQP